MAALGIDPKKVNIILLSHEHMDHTGGLARFLSSNADVSVFLLKSFPSSIKEEAKRKAAKLIEVEGPQVVSENAMTTGEMGTRIREQSLLILTNAGLIIITGCAHPGIVNIVEKAKELTKQEVLLVIGGFHLLRESDATIQKVISSLEKLGVRYVSPGHCTGESARKRFLEAYGEKYISCGVGLKIRAADLSE
jgi:7,8-dihydropterin-6-yl-methyl-4-(beta-D-ribofuranosyl)aminobenzene 5'-phosphate synthase